MKDTMHRATGFVIALVLIPLGLWFARESLAHPGPDQRKQLAVAAGILVFGALGLLMCFSNPTKTARGTKPGYDPLANVLMWWVQNDTPMTVRDLMNGGICIMGRTGSGKTSSSGFQIGKAIVACRAPKLGGLILGSKVEDVGSWQAIFKKAGRLDDLLIFDPSSPYQYNLLDGEQKAGADTRELTDCILTISETLGRSKKHGGGTNEQFWQSLKERCLYNAIEVVRKALGRVTAPDVQAFIIGAANTPAQFASDEWKKGFHAKCLRAAHDAPKTPIEQQDFQQCWDFWAAEYPAMDPKVRSSSLVDILSVLHVFNTGTVHALLSRGTNISPAVMDEGRWILINAPVHNYGAAGLFINCAWKYAVQRHILRRKAERDTCPIIIWSDEYQNTANSFDPRFLCESRSHRGAMVVLTQSIHAFFAAMGDRQGQHEAEALLTNFGCAHVFHALGDDKSAAYATSLVGKSLQTFFGGGQNGRPPDAYTSMFGESHFSANFNERVEAILQNNALFHLRTGGPENQLTADALVVLSGKTFGNGENWAIVPFSQR